MKQLDKALLVRGACTAHYLQALHSLCRLFVAEGLEGRTCDDVLVRVLLCPDTYLTCYLACGGWSIASNNLDVYACLTACLHGTRHILAYGIGYGNNAQIGEVLIQEPSVLVWCLGLLVGEYLVGKAQGTHGLVLVGEQ